MMDISIIIPVHDAEKYLERAVKSVLKALEKFDGDGEIILVNNNSTDESPKIMADLAQQYSKIIHTFSHNMAGAGAARNYGVTKARGEYFWFMDADDTITPDSIRTLMGVARKTEADFVMLGATRRFPDGREEHIAAYSPESPDFESRFVRSELGPWQVIIKRSWYNKHGFKFVEGIMHEDMEMMPALILHTKKYAAIDKPFYIYYQNDGSTLHKKTWSPRIFDIFPALEGLYGRFDEMGAVEKFHSELEWFFIWNLLMDSARDFARFPEGREGFSRARKMLKKYFPKWRKNRFLKNTSLKTRAKILSNYFLSRRRI